MFGKPTTGGDLLFHHHMHWPHPHWTDHLHLLHWSTHHHHQHGPSHGPLTAGAYVGRVGFLATACGIGTATAIGFCIGCVAAADTGDSGASATGSGDISSSQSVTPGPSRSSRAASDTVRVPTAAQRDSSSHAAQRSAVSRRAVGRNAPRSTEITLDLPDDVFAPTAPAVSGQTSHDAPASTAVGYALTDIRVVSPPVSSLPVVVAVKGFLASLSGDATPAAGESRLALMVVAVRRELLSAVDPQIAASKVSASATTSSSSSSSVDAEKMSVSGAGRSVSDRNAVGGYALAFSGSGVASTTLSLPSAAALTVRVRTATGAPDMTLAIDGVRYTTVLVNNTSYTDYTFAGGIAAGTHVVSLASTTATTRNVLYIDSVNVSSGPIVEDFVGKSGAAPGSRWSTRTGTGFDSGAQAYSSSNAVLDGQGHLVISAVKNKSGGYTSGWVWSKNTMTFGYGTVTARIKMPKGQGLWPAVWMMGADSDTAGWPASGEIDIAELPSTTTTVYSTLHGPIAGTTDTQQAQIVSKLPDLSTDYHNYWVRHLPNEITFGVDNQTLGTLTPNSLGPGESWVYNRPMYLIMNLAVGGSWAGAPNSSTLFPAKMTIDSVRFDPA